MPTQEKFRAVKPYFSPGRDPQTNIIGFMDRTTKTFDGAVYSFTDPEIAAAVKRMLERKVAVRLIVDREQALNAAMAKVLDDLRAAGVNIRADRESGYMHSKYAISDGMAVLTGSYNWTIRALKLNRENLVIIRKKSKRKNWAVDLILDEFKANYEEMWVKNAPPVNPSAPSSSSPPPSAPSAPAAPTP